MKNKLFLSLLLLLFPITLLASSKSGDSRVSSKKNRNSQLARHNILRKQTGNVIKFSGYTWTVKSTTGDQKRGPGPNKWSNENAYVDKNGFLHLKITRNATNNTWSCAEVIMTEKLGYGTYQWKVDGRIDTLDRNIVLGLFNYSGDEYHDEMDIEFSRWGRADNKNLNYTIWPAAGVTTPRNVEYVKDFTLNGTFTTHRFKRTSDSLSFTSLEGFQDGDKNIYASKSWYAPATSISQIEMPVFMNLWLFKAVSPVNGKDVEIVIREFKFTPL